MPHIEIVPVDDNRKLRQFIRLPWKIYRGDPYWVPPLLMDVKKQLNRKVNPFFLHSSAQYFLARRDGETVGRIAAILNNRHNEYHKEKTGFFGFFESVNDPQVAAALLDTATEWVRAQGMTILRGPMNFSTNDPCGLLIEGFDKSPVILMTYNPRYYLDLLEGYGFQKAMDLYSWWMEKDIGINPKILKIGEKVLQEEHFEMRHLDMKNFEAEVATIKRLYNDAWSTNWGFVPMTDAEFDHMAKDLKPVVNPKIVLIVEKEGEPVGFSLSLPDLNQALKHMNGRLFPFGILKALYYSKRIHSVRVLALGVIKKYQTGSGIGSALYMETFRRGVAAGYDSGEFSWTLENNELINRGMKLLGAGIYKKYRIYDKPV